MTLTISDPRDSIPRGGLSVDELSTRQLLDIYGAWKAELNEARDDKIGDDWQWIATCHFQMSEIASELERR